MPRFAYQAKDATGRRISGQSDGASAASVAQQLTETGVTPLTIVAADEAAQSSDGLFDFKLFKKKVTLDELIIFSHQMASLTKAGISVVRAARGLSESVKNERFASVLENIALDLEAGVDFATALQRHRGVFPDLYVSVIHVGENTGALDEAFKRIAIYLELERETVKRVKSATRYPMFVVIAIGIAVTILNMFVIPAFADVFAKFGAELPWQTRVILGVSDFFVSYWYLVFGAIAAGILGFRRWVATEEGHHRWDYVKLKIPLLGSIFERINLARFCQTFAMVMRAGVPVTQGLNIVSSAIGNQYMARKVREMRSGIERGESITQTAAASGLFTAVVMQMIAVGEETGSIEELLAQAAGFYEEEVDYELKGLTDAIEPILIIAIGMMVLVLALGVFLPLWDLSGVATR